MTATTARTTLAMADGVASLRLNRPRAGNAIDPAMAASVDDALRRVEDTDGVRAVLVSGAGRAFCVGGDVRYFGRHLDALPDALEEMTAVWQESVLPRLARLPVPVVAAAHGIVGGGGLGLLWCADVVIAADDLHLVSGFSALGLPGDGGSTWFLPRLVGLRRAQQFLLRSAPLSAGEALDWGLVSRVVPASSLLDIAGAEAAAFASGPTWALGAMKGLLAAGVDSTYPDHLTRERRVMCTGAGRRDAREGIRAALAGRRAVFDGT